MNAAKQVAVTLAAAGAAVGGAAGTAFADAEGQAVAANSPGVASGNIVTVPVHVPINFCGNTVNIIAALNPTFGNTCVND